jgi:hypothetical protein
MVDGVVLQPLGHICIIMGKQRSAKERLEESRAETARLELLVAQEQRDEALEKGLVADDDVDAFKALGKDAKSIRTITKVIGRYTEGPEGAEARELIALLGDFHDDLVSRMDGLISQPGDES